MPRGQFQLLRCQALGVEAVQAHTAFAFGRHMHEQFGIGLIDRGAQKSASGRGMVEAGEGMLITVNPGEVHDGTPIGGQARAWRMLYLDPALVGALGADLAGSRASGIEFHRPVMHDPRLAARFNRLFLAMTRPRASNDGGLLRDEALLQVLAALLQPRPPATHPIPGGIARARTLMDDCAAAALTLPELACEAGLSPSQFLRGFQRATGLTPHAYLVQRRLHRARHLIARGTTLADAALDSGFADQSHMTRQFVRSFGLTPGMYARTRA